MSTLGKRVWQQCHRGFESLPVRHLVYQDRFCVFVRNHGVFWVSGFLVFRMDDRPVLLKSWKSVGNAAFFCRGLRI